MLFNVIDTKCLILIWAIIVLVQISVRFEVTLSPPLFLSLSKFSKMLKDPHFHKEHVQIRSGKGTDLAPSLVANPVFEVRCKSPLMIEPSITFSREGGESDRTTMDNV